MPKPRLSPRKSPRQQRSATTVAHLLEAAARVLERRGLEGYNTNAVAEVAGVSVGSLYQYFPGKDALTAALIRAQSVALATALGEVFEDPQLSFDAALSALVRVAVAQQLDRPQLARLLDLEESRLPVQRDTVAAKQTIGAGVATLLMRHGIDAGLPLPVVVGDLFAISRGMIDAAGAAGEVDRDALASRVERALRGYLGLALARTRESGHRRSATAAIVPPQPTRRSHHGNSAPSKVRKRPPSAGPTRSST
jgi:AcrR family transcriptional regulator